MPEKSIWESNFWKTIVAISVILTIISYLLQISGRVNFWDSLILPIINFFTIPIPLYSIPLAFLVVLIIILVLTYTGGPDTGLTSYTLARADFLDQDCIRYVAKLCKIPRTANFLKQKYLECLRQHELRGYSPDDMLKELDNRGLLLFQNGKLHQNLYNTLKNSTVTRHSLALFGFGFGLKLLSTHRKKSSNR